MVFVHGGSLLLGSGAQLVYRGGGLAEEGCVVVVTLNYRLGPLGFLPTQDGGGGSGGMNGIRDQIAALSWVQRGKG
eukprot:gene12696-22704_t